jgi:hypothetical protein
LFFLVKELKEQSDLPEHKDQQEKELKEQQDLTELRVLKETQEHKELKAIMDQ